MGVKGVGGGGDDRASPAIANAVVERFRRSACAIDMPFTPGGCGGRPTLVAPVGETRRRGAK
jgi:hypothetical protein